MQDQYVGDEGDFGKYGLLRSLCNPDAKVDKGDAQPLSLGVVWYSNPDKITAKKDKDRTREYLDETNDKKSERFKECDPELYVELGRIVEDRENLTVAKITENQVLPSGTVYYQDALPTANSLQEERRSWAKRARCKISNCNVVFVDPDNGLEPKSWNRSFNKQSSKYAYFEELKPFTENNRSLVIYHHLNRSGVMAQQIYDRQLQIKEKIGCNFAMLYNCPSSPRAFFVIPSPCYQDLLLSRAESMIDGPWAQHFMMVGQVRYLRWIKERLGQRT